MLSSEEILLPNGMLPSGVGAFGNDSQYIFIKEEIIRADLESFYRSLKPKQR